MNPLARPSAPRPASAGAKICLTEPAGSGFLTVRPLASVVVADNESTQTDPREDQAATQAPAEKHAAPATPPGLQGAPPRDGFPTLPITALIFAAMLVSTAASISGGLIMYFESVKSLEDAVRDTSVSELDFVAMRINNIAFGIRADGDAMINTMYATALLDASDQSQWAELARYTQYSMIKAKPSTYCLGLAAMPKAGDENAAWYTTTWCDPNRDGSCSMAVGVRHTPHDANESVHGDAATGYLSPTPTYAVNYTSGARGEYLYTWDSNEPFVQGIMEGYDASDADGDKRLGAMHLGNMAWFTQDKFVYAYSGWNIVYKPPPPPHPWSRFEGINVIALYTYAPWSAVFEEYRNRYDPSTDVIAMDDKTLEIYATTTGEQKIDQDCFDSGSITLVDDCATKLQNMSVAVQQLYAKYNTSRDVEFRKLELGGQEYFTRRRVLFNDVVLFWMRPTDTVNDKVNAALIVLVIFAIVVFVFDVVLSTLELQFVARPMESLARTIVHVGSMDTRRAQASLGKMKSARFMVTEVHTLVVFLTHTLNNIEEFKSYIPHSVFARNDKDEAPESLDDRSLRSSISTSATGSSQQMQASASASMVATLGVSAEDAPTAPQHMVGVIRAASSTLKLSLDTKRFALCFINLCEFHKFVNNNDSPKVLAFMEDMLARIMTHLRAARGVLESFSGDHYTGSFNASLLNSSYTQQALTFAVRMSDEMYRNDSALRASVVTGRGLLGNAGCATARKYSFLSPSFGLGTALLDLARLYQVNVAYAVAEGSFSHVSFDTRVLAACMYTKQKADDVFEVREVMSIASLACDEWMYELDRPNPAAPWDAWASNIFNQDWSAADKMAALAAAYDSTSPAAQVLRDAFARKSYRVLDLAAPFAYTMMAWGAVVDM